MAPEPTGSDNPGPTTPPAVVSQGATAAVGPRLRSVPPPSQADGEKPVEGSDARGSDPPEGDAASAAEPSGSEQPASAAPGETPGDNIAPADGDAVSRAQGSSAKRRAGGPASGRRRRSRAVSEPYTPAETDPATGLPTKDSLWGVDPIRHSARFARAPWLDALNVSDEYLLRNYAIGDRLPGGIPLRALKTEDWRRSCAPGDESLFRRGSEDILDVRARFARAVYTHVFRLGTHHPLPSGTELDVWSYRSLREREYADALDCLDDHQVANWRNQFSVTDAAMLDPVPQIPAEFRYKSKDTNYWRD